MSLINNVGVHTIFNKNSTMHMYHLQTNCTSASLFGKYAVPGTPADGNAMSLGRGSRAVGDGSKPVVELLHKIMGTVWICVHHLHLNPDSRLQKCNYIFGIGLRSIATLWQFITV